MNLNKALLVVLLCACGSLAQANTKHDLMQEVKILASNSYADLKNKRIVYEGPVRLTQGSLVLNADQLSSFTDEKTGKRILLAKGKPATYQQKVEDGRTVQASANEISYNIDSRVMSLKGSAKVEQDGSQVTADSIVYDIQKQQLTSQSSGKRDDQVITIIQPENYQQELQDKGKQENNPSNSEKQQ
ncbi:lipopolysaccharide transport periplasmic protein LptA [Shewanella sp. JM162201]|uniref:Lipopolysaccharide export system protein LptA n=1 Tax=Shewanella jiangmenensis TaxID=2837387 RepID=A0ABS5V278_9GAMM|nr:lipopolysaccharide transport periplasmic protein LptA [Shewanella jiangmenensis]MBT1443906.1 lipopolysaccharide transport periplasmic protein LptA [Shewanella jiangmenensis]